MKIHEYQAKEILRRFGVVTPRGVACFSVDEAVAAAQKLGGSMWVVKAQIHAGGRGKAGGVKLAKSGEEVRAAATGMLGTRLKTKQTGAAGLPVNLVFVESGSSIERELYLSLLVDRGRWRIGLAAVAVVATALIMAGSLATWGAGTLQPFVFAAGRLSQNSIFSFLRGAISPLRLVWSTPNVDWLSTPLLVVSVGVESIAFPTAAATTRNGMFD